MEDRDRIPMLLQKLFPQLTNDDYASLMKDERFRMKTIPFCYACFIDLTKNEKLAGINIIQGRSNDELIEQYIKGDKDLKDIHVIKFVLVSLKRDINLLYNFYINDKLLSSLEMDCSSYFNKKF